MPPRGNHAPGFPLHGHQHPSSGAGGVHRLTSFGRVAVSGKIGEVHKIALDGLAQHMSQNQAILVQSVGGTVVTAVTLAPPELALDPNNNNVWVTDVTVATGELKPLNVSAASAIRLTFTTASTVYIAVT